MNQATGKVMLKETKAGIPNLLVEVYNFALGTRPEEILPGGVAPDRSTAAAAHTLALGDRLGSTLTGVGGQFSLTYDDEDFRRRNPQEKRPDLLLMVRAPEDMSAADKNNTLHVSKDIRQNAGVSEAYIIYIPSSKLAAAGVPAPTNVEIDTEEPDAVIRKAQLTVAREARIKDAVQKIAAKQVAAHRERTEQVEKEVEDRLLEKLSGVPNRLAERLNYVRPGDDVHTAMFRALNRSIETTINRAPPATGFMVLTEEQAQKFRKPDGSFREDIRAEEIHPHLFGSANQSQRTNWLIREDPTTASPAEVPSLQAETGGPSILSSSPPEVNGGDVGGNGNSGEVIPGFVDRLIRTMTSPEEALLTDLEPRATQDDVDGNIGSFALHTGPADVPAFYDFHSLQIAFDYVWQKAIDDGVIEGARTLGRQILDMGGDPLAAIKNGGHPIKALRNELKVIQAAHADSNLTALMSPGVTGSLRANQVLDPTGGGSGGGGGLGPHGPNTHPDLFGGNLVLEQVNGPFPHELLNQIESLLNERFAFEIFAPGSVNYGILVSYRQRWKPINYQAGNLIKTITLAPKESRKVSSKQVIKKERAVKEMENSLRVRKEEANQTARDEAEIVAKAEAKTNFSLTSKGSYNIGISKGDATTVFGKDASTNSSDIKKAFREAVVKAAQEYKDERKLEVETKESFEGEATESAEISNPNEELPVTFLFYELQRRFDVSEHIHRLIPVVLVAMDVPNPSRRAIDTLLLTYGWVIDRVLLDDQFRKPLEYFRTKLVGEEFAIRQMERNLATMQQVVEELKRSYTQARSISNQSADLLTAETVRRAQAVAEGDSEGFFEKAKESLVGDGGGESVEAYRIFEDVARERFERAIQKEKELRSQLDSETAALKGASDAYAKALADHLNCQMDIGTMRLHIKSNILYYMQAIWSHMFDDEIFLTLHKKLVPRLAPKQQSYKLSQPAQPPSSTPAMAGQVVVEVAAQVELEGGLDPEEDFVTLSEIADLDNMLGFKGNYMIFPLRQSNALTDFMMTPFVDSELGLRDPDEFGNFTPEEFEICARNLIAEMRAQLQRGEISETALQEAIDRLSEQFRRLLSNPRPAEEEIIVPTGSLFIDALPGAHPILEDFKLKHRAIDVKKVQAEVRRMELENVRYAARILEGEREDPDIERKVVIVGDGQAVVVPPVDN